VGKAVTRFFGGVFILGAAVGSGSIGVGVVTSAPAGAAPPIVVNDASDPASPLPAGNCDPSSEGDCTLRAALAEATVLSTVTINLPDPTTVPNNPGSYYSVSGNELDITDTGGTVTIVGDVGSPVEIRAIDNTRVMELGSGSMGGVHADISGVTISNGNAPSYQGSDCGGICVSSSNSHLTLTNSVVSGNTAGTFGGGIGLYRGGSATLIGDTITGNTVATASNADGGGGGIYVVNNDTSTTANLTIRDTTISDNVVDAGAGNGSGGGIDVFNTTPGSGVDANVTIHIDDTTISGNEITGATGAGSGIAASDGNWAVTNSTISGNTETAGTQVDGGGAFISNAAGGTSLTSTWIFDTIAGNAAGSTSQGGNFNVQGGALNLQESIVAGGVAGGSASNCFVSGGSLNSLGYNLIDDTSCGTPATSDIVGQSPQLGALVNNGGPTFTQLPASTSPAVSGVPATVTSGTGATVDQRGEPRGLGQHGSSTIGSVEVAQATPPPPTTTTTTTTSPTTLTTTHGYWLVGSDGGIFSFGSAQFHGSTGGIALQRPVVGISPTANNAGYWLVGSDGGTFAFGNAGYYGSIPGDGLAPAGSGLPHSLNAPIVGMVPSSDGGGYFMVASDGGVFAFGDAHFAGSCPGVGGCAGAAAAVVPDASGNGYWLITKTGNVYAFGDAPYHGGPGNQGFPVTSAVRTGDGGGYYVLLADGAVYAYGDAVARGGPVGSIGALNEASAIFTDADGGGYWAAAADGAVFSYGDATDEGSMAGNHINGSIIAAAGF